MTNKRIQLKIGILEYESSWKVLLDQIGVDWDSIESLNDISSSNYSVLIINRTLTAIEQKLIIDYTMTGGAIIYTVGEKQQVREKSVVLQFVSSLAPCYCEEYQFSDIFDIFANTYLFSENSLIMTEQLGEGFVSYLGVDVNLILGEQSSLRKNIYAQRKRLPHEIVSKRTRSALRQLVQSHLEFLHHRRNLPFIHKWFYPQEHQTLFTFRIDSDKGSQAQIEEIFQLSEQYNIPTTWFLDVKSHETWLDYFKKFSHQEIAVHCYEHIAFNNSQSNIENFGKALSLLQCQGFQAKGIAAPTGAWNTAIGSALQELDFFYSSEFAYDHDNLPSFPLIGNAFSAVVQLPIHPICIGTMLREHMSTEEMIEYFFMVIDQKITQREPICLYHHPTHRTNEVFKKVFEYINQKKLLKLSYIEYAEWWNRRNNFSFTATYAEKKIILETKQFSKDTFVRISLPNETETICPVQEIIAFDEKTWSLVSKHIVVPKDILRIRKTTFRHYIQNALDWWIKTTE